MWVLIDLGYRSGSCSPGNRGFRIAQVVRCHSENGISHSENQFLNSESCSENIPELSESSENGLFSLRASGLKFQARKRNINTNFLVPTKPGLSLGQTHFVPGQAQVLSLFLHNGSPRGKPRLSLGQSRPRDSQGRRAAEKVYVFKVYVPFPLAKAGVVPAPRLLTWCGCNRRFGMARSCRVRTQDVMQASGCASQSRGAHRACRNGRWLEAPTIRGERTWPVAFLDGLTWRGKNLGHSGWEGFV